MVLSPETVRYPHARKPRPQDLHHHFMGPAPIDGGPVKTPNPAPCPPTRHPVSSACTATEFRKASTNSSASRSSAWHRPEAVTSRPQATRNSSATFRETPPPMLQVRRQRPRPPPPPSPTTPAGDGATAPASDIDASSHPPSETAG